MAQTLHRHWRNKGGYAAELLSLTQSHVIAFEPLPKAFEMLSQLKSRFEGRLECINMGVGDCHDDSWNCAMGRLTRRTPRSVPR